MMHQCRCNIQNVILCKLLPHNFVSHLNPVLLPPVLLKVFEFKLRMEDYAKHEVVEEKPKYVPIAIW